MPIRLICNKNLFFSALIAWIINSWDVFLHCIVPSTASGSVVMRYFCYVNAINHGKFVTCKPFPYSNDNLDSESRNIT